MRSLLQWTLLVLALHGAAQSVAAQDGPSRSADDAPPAVDSTAGESAFPAFVLSQMTATGEADGEHLELAVQFEARVTGGQAVAIPLRLDECILLDEPEFEGDGEQLLRVDPGGGGLSWSLRGTKEPCQVRFRCRVKLGGLDGETLLRLTAPVATRAEITFTAPGEQSAGVALRADADTPRFADGETTFTLRGLSGAVTFTWRPKDERIVRGSPELGASLLVKSQYDGLRRLLVSSAAIRVRSINESSQFSQFSVRLPAGAVVESTSPPDAQVQTIGVGADARGVLLFRHAPTDAFTAEIRYHQSLGEDAAQYHALPGIEVSGARQWGHLALKANGQWRMDWRPLDFKLCDRVPASEAPGDVAAAGFDTVFELYSAQAAVSARFYRPEPRVSVEPEFVFLLGADEIQCEGRLRCAASGAASSVRIDLREWLEWYFVEAFIDTQPPQPLAIEDGQILVPLGKEAATGTVVRLRAVRDMPRGTESVSLAPPAISPAARRTRVWVQPQDNLTLEAQEGTSPGWRRMPAASSPPADLLTGVWSKPALSYVVSGGALRPLLTKFQVHPQQLAVAERAEIAFSPTVATVRQTTQIALLHVPLTELEFVAPPEAWQSPAFQVAQGGTALSPVWVGAAVSGKSRRGKLVFPTPLPSGVSEVVFRWDVPQPPLPAGDSRLATFSLIQSPSAEQRGVRVSVEAPSWLQVSGTDESWRNEDVADAPTAGQVTSRFSTLEGASEIRLQLAREAARAEGKLHIDKAWIQSWLFGGERRDRVLYRFSSSGGTIGLVLPNGAAWYQVQLNASTAALERNSDGTDTIRIPDTLRPQEYLLDMQYHLAATNGAQSTTLEFVHPVSAWIQQGWLQVIVPAQQHLLWTPAGLTSESHWARHGVWWERVPRLDPGELNAWMDARSFEPPPNANQYDFSFFGEFPQVELALASRGWLVGLASVGTLAVGLLLTYVPAFRRRGLLWILAGCLLAVALVFPEPALLIAQASSLGLVLAIAAAAMRRLFVQRPAVVARGKTSGSSMRYEFGSTQPGQPIPVISRLRASTLTGAAAPQAEE